MLGESAFVANEGEEGGQAFIDNDSDAYQERSRSQDASHDFAAMLGPAED